MFLLFAQPLIYLPCFITHNYFESCFCVYQNLIPFVPEYYSILWICYISISHWCTFGPFSVWAYQTCYEYPCTNLCIDPCFHLSQEIWSSMSGSQDRCFNLRNSKLSKVCSIFHSHSMYGCSCCSISLPILTVGRQPFQQVCRVISLWLSFS